MEYVGETVNHYYSLKDRLGQGAFSCVFLGYNKVTGVKRALKVPKRSGFQKATERETEALLSLKHKNIVQLFGIEDEMISNKTVIIMEYCSGGSLQSMLQEPEYMNGLPDLLFRLLLTHLAAGLKELHSKDFVHRDIKPANILITKEIPNTIIFKISDFGSSRQNHSQFDEEMCLSLAGTEEYLHPLLYKGAFIQKSNRVKVNSCIDKWALGVTLYHAATGDVLFKPFGGARRNRQTMFLMISQKPRGKICGTQETENGKILWRSEFPTSCNISSGLKSRLVPIMSGLMEGDNTRQWTYGTFFKEVELIDSSIPIYIINACDLQHLTVYLNPNERVSMLYEMIAAETDIDRRFQKLYFEMNNIEHNISLDTTAKELPKTTKNNPFILFSTIDTESFCNHSVQYDISTLDNANLRNEVLIKVGRRAACIIADLCNIVKEIHHTKNLILSFLDKSRQNNELNFFEIKKEFHLLSMIAEERQTRMSCSIPFMQSIQTDSPLKSRGSSRSSLPQTKLYQVLKVVNYIRENITNTEKSMQINIKLRHSDTVNPSLCSNECDEIMQSFLKSAKETLVDITKYSYIRDKTPLDLIRNKYLRDNILTLVYKARNHWVTHCDCEKKFFINRIQDIIRDELNIGDKLRELSNNIEELRDLINSPMSSSSIDCSKMSINCSEDINSSINKESTKLETDGLICSGKESLNRLERESDDFISILNDITLKDS